MHSAPVNRTATAVMETPFGCGIRWEGDQPIVEHERALVQGIVRRTANRPEAQAGEQLLICTDGGLQAEIVPGKPGWEVIEKGKLTDAAN